MSISLVYHQTKNLAMRSSKAFHSSKAAAAAVVTVAALGTVIILYQRKSFQLPTIELITDEDEDFVLCESFFDAYAFFKQS